MRQIITTYVVVVVLLALGFFGVGTLARAAELRDPLQPPAFALQKFRQAKLSSRPAVTTSTAVKPQQKPLQLTSILISRNRKIAISDDQMLAVGVVAVLLLKKLQRAGRSRQRQIFLKA